jgi:16S rRNA (guanine527-N7)-methyltransferase
VKQLKPVALRSSLWKTCVEPNRTPPPRRSGALARHHEDLPVDNSTIDQLEKGLATLGLTLPATAIAQLVAWADELVRWNAKVNLTAIRQPLEIVDKHLLDSLAVLPEVAGATRLLDLGAGAGLPGLPLAVALPDLRATLVDAVAKKVGFLKAAAVKAGVAARVKALHLRVNGNPAAEHLEPADLVISRAFLDVGPFLALARSYVEPGGPRRGDARSEPLRGRPDRPWQCRQSSVHLPASLHPAPFG